MGFLLRTCFVAIVIQACVEAKVQRGSLQFTGNADDATNWQFMSKFGFATGTGEYRIRYRIPEGADKATNSLAELNLMLDEEWPEAQRHHGSGACGLRKKLARDTYSVALRQPGEWSNWKAGTVTQKLRPHIWYFVTSFCDVDFSALPLSVEFEIDMNQENGSHFSVEMYGMLKLNILVLLCLVTFLVRYCRRCQVFASSAGSLHTVIWWLSSAIFMQFMAQALHTLHLQSYQSNGVGILLLDWLSEVLFMLSQVVQTTLLIAIAMGYTLLPARSDNMVVVRAIAVMSFLIHTVLVSFGKMQDESASKYHENEGAIGWVLLSVRLMLFVWFVFAVEASRTEGGLRLDDFLHKFRLAGSMYFLAYPVLFVVVQVFAAYLRHPILQIGLIAMQTISNVCLAELFLSRGTYFKVSVLSSSFLPGSHGMGSFDKVS
jgi:hypothetical protein